MKEQIYIFDLDHTLFNAKRFREDLGLLINNNKNTITEIIWEAFENKDIRLFNFIKDETKKYLFSDVLKNLKRIKEHKILLSFGNLAYQAEKIKALGFYEIFDEVILTDKNKINFLLDFYKKNKEKEIIFINDTYNKRFNENKEISEKIPAIKIFEVDNYLVEKNKTIGEIFKEI